MPTRPRPPASRSPSHYVVRVYRWGRPDLRRIVGIVEEVGSKGRRAFTNLDELWQILSATRRGSTRHQATARFPK